MSEANDVASDEALAEMCDEVFAGAEDLESMVITEDWAGAEETIQTMRQQLTVLEEHIKKRMA